MIELNPNFHFTSVIYNYYKPDWVESTLNICQPYIDEVKEKNTQYKKIFPVWQTDNLQSVEDLKYFTEFVLQASQSILDSQGYDLSKHELYFDELWAQEVHTYGHHSRHEHPNCHISGFYFLECPNEGIFPIFFDPRPGKSMTDLPEKNVNDITLASQMCNYKPVSGMFIFFNSYLPHMFQLNGSDQPCKFIHFNLAARRRYQK